MPAVKAVLVPYEPSEEALELLKAFRDTVNCCLQVGLEKGIKSRFRLSNEAYHSLTGMASYLVLSSSHRGRQLS